MAYMNLLEMNTLLNILLQSCVLWQWVLLPGHSVAH